MKNSKTFLLFSIFVVALLTIISCDNEALEQELAPQFDEAGSDAGLKENYVSFRLWSLCTLHIKPEDFWRYEPNFRLISNTKHEFKVWGGDGCTVNNRYQCRVEAYDMESFNPGSTWHQFEAEFEINTEARQKICFLQLKSKKTEKPQIMCHITDGTKLTYQPRTKGARTIANIQPKQRFKLKIRSNGKTEEVYYNGEKIYSGTPHDTSSDVRNYFRWGIYNNLEQERYMRVTVRDINHY